MTAPVRMVEFQRFLDRVLTYPVARAAFERAQKQPPPLRVDGKEYHRRQRSRS